MSGKLGALNTALKVEWLQGCRTVVSTSVVYLGDGVADWELQLTATAQHHEHLTALSLA